MGHPPRGEVAIGELVDGGLGGALIADARRILAIGDRAAQPDRLRSRLLRRDLAVAPEHNPPLSAACAIFYHIDARPLGVTFTPNPGTLSSHA
jgi:hypothetical protein